MPSRKEIFIAPAKGFLSLRLGELMQYRDLTYFLAWRDVKIRYKQTLLGAVWVILQPLLTMILFWALFGRISRFSQNGSPYPIFVLCGLVPWQFFAYTLAQSSHRLVDDAAIIRKVYFPRILIPLASMLAGLLDFFIAFAVLLLFIFLSAVSVGPNILLVLPGILLAVVTSTGVALWLSALNVKYRDIKFTVPFIAQLWFFSTPIIYPWDILPQEWLWVMGLNPMTGVVCLFRWALLGKVPPDAALLFIPILIALIILISGLIYFRQMENRFADII